MRAVIFLCLLAPACGESGPNPSPPALELSGTVEDTLGVLVEGATVWVRIWDTTATALTEDSLSTDATGRFSGSIPISRILDSTEVELVIRPPFGSGWGTSFVVLPIRFDRSGRAERRDLVLTVTRREPAVPRGPPSALAPADLAGDYSGQTVHPLALVGGVYLDLSLTPVGSGAFGRYRMDFDATTVCGDGSGSVTGLVVRDTLFLRLTSDSFPGWNRVPLVNEFIATTYSPGADTLILTYPWRGDCSVGFPAPLRLIR